MVWTLPRWTGNDRFVTGDLRNVRALSAEELEVLLGVANEPRFADEKGRSRQRIELTACAAHSLTEPSLRPSHGAAPVAHADHARGERTTPVVLPG